MAGTWNYEAIVTNDCGGQSDTLSGSFVVNAAQQQAPTAHCKNITATLDANGTATVMAIEIDNGSTDNDGNIVSMTINNLNQLSFDCSQIGTQTVTLEVIDNDGLSSNCMATVTVVDDMIPFLDCAFDFTLQLALGETTTLDINDLILSVSDNCNFTTTADLLTFTGDNPGSFSSTVSVLDDGLNESICIINITVDQSSAVIDIAKDQRISVYPNPTKNQVNISVDKSLEVQKVILFDSAGRLLKESNYSPQFSTASLPRGIYSLAIITSEEVFMTRLLKL